MLPCRLNFDTRIVKNLQFIAGSLKLQKKDKRSLCLKPKKFALQPLLLEPQLEAGKSAQHDSIDKMALKLIRFQSSMVSWCLSNKFILTASNICELLFSVRGFVLTNRREECRSRTSRPMFYMNRSVWGADDVRGLKNNSTLRREH